MTGPEWTGVIVAAGVPTLGVVYAAGRVTRAVDDLSTRVMVIEDWIRQFGSRRR